MTIDPEISDLQPEIPDYSGKTILVADDLDINYILIEALLRKTQANLLWAKDGQQAMEMVIKDCNAIHLILMDIKMPVMNGLEATLAIRKHCSNIPVIAQTAFSYIYDREAALNAGCIDYIEKPVSGFKLLEIINRYIH